MNVRQVGAHRPTADQRRDGPRVDAALRGGWQGASNDDFPRVVINQVIALGRQAARRHRVGERRRHSPNEQVWL